MNIDQILISYLYAYGDLVSGMIYIDDNPGINITKINVIPDEEVIEFCKEDELVKTIKKGELVNIYIGMNYADKLDYTPNISYSHKVIFELKGFSDLRLFIDLKFDPIIR